MVALWKWTASAVVLWTMITTTSVLSLTNPVQRKQARIGSEGTTRGNASPLKNRVDELITLPLIPHHQQLARLRRRLGSSAVNSVEDELLHRSLDQIPDDERNPLGFRHQVDALFQGYGTHYVDMWVGNPPQRQTLIVGTGSAYAAFPCSECDDCGDDNHIDDYFDDTSSETFQVVECGSCFKYATCKTSSFTGKDQCRFSENYAEGSSFQAFEASDFVYLGGPHDEALPVGTKSKHRDGVDPYEAADYNFRMVFGCQLDIRGLFKTQMADGMLGMSNSDVSFWKQMYDGKVMDRRQFSLCFNRQRFATREGTEAGALTLGGTDVRLHNSQMQFANQVEGLHKDYFYVRINGIDLRVNGGDRAHPSVPSDGARLQSVEADVARPFALLESGTTDTYLPQGYLAGLEAAWSKVTGGTRFPGSGQGIDLTLEQLEALPTLLFRLQKKVSGIHAPGTDWLMENITVAFPPSHYMEYSTKFGKYFCRLYFEIGEGVLGANFLMGHDIMFDVQDERIGFAESECDYDNLVAEDASEQRSGDSPSAQGGNGASEEQPSSGSTAGKDARPTTTTETVSPPSAGSSSPGTDTYVDDRVYDRAGPQSAEESKDKDKGCGVGCRAGVTLLCLLLVGGVGAALFIHRDTIWNLTAHEERGLYHRTAMEIPMTTIDDVPVSESDVGIFGKSDMPGIS